MALYNVKLKIEYTVDLLVEGVSTAEDARRVAALEAAEIVEEAFLDQRDGRIAVGESTPLEAVCVSEFA